MVPINYRNHDPPVKKNAFVHKLYRMLHDPNLTHIIWWSGNPMGHTFSLSPGKEFADALSKYFKHGNVASFVRQLHMYGFHKVTEPLLGHVEHAALIWEFRHSSGKFRRGDEASLAYIKRRPQTALQRDSALEQATAKLLGKPQALAPTSGPPHGSSTLSFYQQYSPIFIAGTSVHGVPQGVPQSIPQGIPQGLQQAPPHVSHYSNPHPAANFHAPYPGYVYYAPQNVPMYTPVLNSAPPPPPPPPPQPSVPENHGYFAPLAPYAYSHTPHGPPQAPPPGSPSGNGGYTLPSGFPQGYGSAYVLQVPDLQWRPTYPLASASASSPPALPAPPVASRAPYIVKKEHTAPSPGTMASKSPVALSTAPVPVPVPAPTSTPQTPMMRPDPSVQPSVQLSGSHASLPTGEERSLSESDLQFRKPFDLSFAHRNRIPSLLCDPLTDVCSVNHHHPQNQHQNAGLVALPDGPDAVRPPASWTSRSWVNSLPSMDEISGLPSGRQSPRTMFSPRSSSSSILNPAISQPSSFSQQPEADSMRKAILTATTGKDKIRPSLVEIHAARPPPTTAEMKSVTSISSYSSSIFSNNSSISSASSGRFLSFGSISHVAPPTGVRCVSPLANAPEKDQRLVHLPSLSEHSGVDISPQETCFTPVALVGKPQDTPLNTQLPKVEFMLESTTDRHKRPKTEE